MIYFNEIYHYGIPRRSGRYPYGSGERPYQDKEEARRQKNIEVGRERLLNRIEKANKLEDVDRLSRKIGWGYTKRASEAHKNVKNIKQLSREILEDEERTASLGKYTRARRALDLALTSIGSSAVTIGGTVAIESLALPIGTLSLPITASALIGYGGYKYYQKTKY